MIWGDTEDTEVEKCAGKGSMTRGGIHVRTYEGKEQRIEIEREGSNQSRGNEGKTASKTSEHQTGTEATAQPT